MTQKIEFIPTKIYDRKKCFYAIEKKDKDALSKDVKGLNPYIKSKNIIGFKASCYIFFI